MKFGGTSMGSAQRISEVAQIVCAEKKKPIVVVSAMTGVTNMLLEAADVAISKKNLKRLKKIIKDLLKKHYETAEKLISNKKRLKETKEYVWKELHDLEHFLEALAYINELSARSYDRIVAIGEKLSAHLLSAHMNDIGRKTCYVNLEKILKKEHKKINNAFFSSLERKMYSHITPLIIDEGCVPVCTGFFGQIPGGIIEAVGRGYSDFCAAILGSAFKVKEIQVWTDVDGIMSADPRLVKKAFVLPEVSFNEAAEMSSFGAKILHPQTIWPAVRRNIPVRIKNTMNPKFAGTLITQEGKLSDKICKSITAKKGVNLVCLLASDMPVKYGFLAKVFDIFARHEVSIDIVTTSEISISFNIDKPLSKIKPALQELRKLGRVHTESNKAIVAAIGSEMSVKIGSGSKILASIASCGTNAVMISRSSLKINISCIVEESKADELVKTLHKDILEF